MVGAQRRKYVDDRRIAVIDAGKSTTRAAVFAGEALLERRSLHVGFPHPEAPGAHDAVLRAVHETLELLGDGPYDVLVLAATGIRRIGTTEFRVQAALAQHLQCEVLIENDVIAAYLGALGPRAGILVQAGTGSLVVAASERTPPVVLDGWGYLAGDRGSGFALGRAGLRTAFAAVDGTGPPTALRPLITGDDPEQTIRSLYGSGSQARDIAALAPAVLRAAADGDDPALLAVKAVAAELVAMVLAAGRQMADPQLAVLPVAETGGLFENDLFRTTVERGLHEQLPHVRLLHSASDALEGGRLLATTGHEPLTRMLTSAFRNEEL